MFKSPLSQQWYSSSTPYINTRNPPFLHSLWHLKWQVCYLLPLTIWRLSTRLISNFLSFFCQMLFVCSCVTPGCTQCLCNIFSASKQYPFASLLFTAHASCAFPIDAHAQVSDEWEHMWSSLNMFGLIYCLWIWFKFINNRQAWEMVPYSRWSRECSMGWKEVSLMTL